MVALLIQLWVNRFMSWVDRFPELSTLTDREQQLLSEYSLTVSVPRNTVIFGPGQKPDSLLLLLDGTVRVQQLSKYGREIVLYRVYSGESCVLTTACLLASENYSASGITETDVEAVTIPVRLFDDLLSQSTAFRQFVFTAYSQRITELTHVIEGVAFQRIDVRLADKLLELSRGDVTVRITHKELAAELGSAREVVSRQLSEFQRREWIRQSRGSIELVDIDSIKKLVSD